MTSGPPLDILFASPAYWPALAFGGPIWMARELNEGAVRNGHSVEVVTTSLTAVGSGRSFRAVEDEVDGVHIRRLATPLHYRWMGVTPSLPVFLAQRPRPDIVHLFGFRDVVTTITGLWCKRHSIPYVFEPLGMFAPRLRKVRIKRGFDATVARTIAANARVIVATSEWEAETIERSGVERHRIVIRGNGFPAVRAPSARPGALRSELGLTNEQIVLYVGRIASGKGIEFLLDTVAALPDTHLVVVGPDDGHGVGETVRRAATADSTRGRVHELHPRERPLRLYGDADVFVLPSAGESFGMVAAEAAAAGVPVIVTDRCGIAEVLGPAGAALVVPHESGAVTAAVRRVLEDESLRRELVQRATAVARANGWETIVARQESIYRRALVA